MAAGQTKINYSPPKAVQNACKKGLALKDAYGGKGLRAPTVAWAEHFASGKDNDAAHARKMRAWFARHDVDQKPGWDKPPTPGFVARLLWGGDAAQRWVHKLVAQAEKATEREKADKKKSKSKKQSAGKTKARKKTKRSSK